MSPIKRLILSQIKKKMCEFLAFFTEKHYLCSAKVGIVSRLVYPNQTIVIYDSSKLFFPSQERQV